MILARGTGDTKNEQKWTPICVVVGSRRGVERKGGRSDMPSMRGATENERRGVHLSPQLAHLCMPACVTEQETVRLRAYCDKMLARRRLEHSHGHTREGDK